MEASSQSLPPLLASTPCSQCCCRRTNMHARALAAGQLHNLQQAVTKTGAWIVTPLCFWLLLVRLLERGHWLLHLWDL
jgi:hypothetical protein